MATLRSYRRPSRIIEFISATDQLVVDFASRFDDVEAPAPCDGSTFIIRTGGDEVALVSYLVRDRELLLTQLYVLPPYRGFGIGREVLDLLERAEAVDFIRVIATPNSASFYKELGFESDFGCEILTKEVSA